jgi:phosphate transport system permease protein
MFKTIVIFLSLLGIVIPLFILIYIFQESLPAFNQFGAIKYISDPSWFPSEGLLGIKAQITGSILISTLAIMISLPAAIFFTFFNELLVHKKISSLNNFIIDSVAGIPSIIFGLWGLIVLVPFFGKSHPPGTSLLVGSIILAMMTFPHFVIFIRSFVLNFNQFYFLSAKTLHLATFDYFFKIFLPVNQKKIVSLILLMWGKCFGETMAVMMVTGNIANMPNSVYSPIRTLTSTLALEMPYAQELHRSSLFVIAFAICLILAFLTLISIYLSKSKND